ncbi:MAG: SurA N-terminal domain-containing protein [Candidatus Omnitrophica bacterium]|nr:SurA N-terminal domain-containing protein [Candidatus Omnitrophota bacterium]MCM8791198.1 SurA N-terminal domain-containing protein [Candidatus Omnitrophota bacterium]
MLKVFRHKNVAKMVLWGILILILPAFVLWGTGSIGRSGKKGPSFVGTIGGKKISFKEFAESLGSIRCQIVLNYFNQPKVMETFLNSKAFVGKLAWNRLLMLKEAEKHNMKVSDAEVVSYIRSHPIFLRNGQFDERLYSYILRRNLGLEPRTFEEMVRQNLEIQRLNDTITKDVRITEEEITKSYADENRKFKISYIFFTSDRFLDKVNLSDKDIRGYYENHKEEFRLPPKESQTDEQTTAKYEDVKDNIKAFLAEKTAREMAIKHAVEEHAKLKEIMSKEKLTPEAAATKLGLKMQESPFFTRSDFLEGIGDPLKIIDAASGLQKDEISAPIETVKGAVIFRLISVQEYDPAKFAKDKEEFSAKALDAKKAAYLEEWLRGLERSNPVNIDFKDYEKYYR